MDFDLEEYRAQRALREKKRKDFINRFEAIKAKGLVKVAEPKAEKVERIPEEPKKSPREPMNPDNQNMAALEAENKELKIQLLKAEEKSAQQMTTLKKEIVTLKEGYLKQMQEITTLSQKDKEQTQKKIKTLIGQIKQAQKKNTEIQNLNKALKEEAANGQKLFDGYLKDIEKQYREKLAEFETILKESQDKIDEMERNFNEEDVVTNALKNQQLMQAILNSGKAADSVTKEEYEKILKSKTEIVEQLIKNSKQKESEIKRIKELTDKFKAMFETLNAQKKQLIEDNMAMTNELTQIKAIFQETIGKAGLVQQDAEEDEEDEEEEEQKAETAS